MIEADDLVLARRLARDGDPSAFHTLYARHTPMLFAVAFRLLGNRADAEDAVHDSWIRAVEGVHRFQGRSTIRTWLTGVLLNRIREFARMRSHADLEGLGDAEEIATQEQLTLPNQIDPIDLHNAIASLAPGYREIIVLHDVEGYSHDEIGEMLGIETGTSKSQLARGRKRLRELLRGNGGTTDG